MRRASILLLSPLLFAAAAFPQTGPPDNQVTLALLAEIRQLRQDLQITAATIQRVQIVMYRLQVQTDSLNHAAGLRESAQNECRQTEFQRKNITAQIQATEARLRNPQNPSEKSSAEEQLAQLKSSLEDLATEERDCQAQIVETENQFRAEQARLNDLQDQLDKLDKTLAAARPK